VGAFGVAAASAPTGAQASPAAVGDLRLVYGFAAGGTVEAVLQRLVPGLQGAYAQTVRLDSRPGAAGLTAARQVASALGDGSVLLTTPTSSITLVPHIARGEALRLQDLTPVITIGSAPLCFVVGPAVPAEVRTLRHYLRWVELNPDRSGFGSPGVGTGSHLIGAALGRLAQVDLRHVAYRGAGPAVEDLMSGQLPAMSMLLGNYLPRAAAGTLRVLAITGASRSRYVPEVPTYVELGFGLLTELENYAMLMPGRATTAQAEGLADLLRRHLARPERVQALAEIGIDPVLDTPQDLGASLSREFAMWREVVEKAGLKRA
jgi:tripartite-type tricarboxylate transporter receptor subunit TctC